MEDCFLWKRPFLGWLFFLQYVENKDAQIIKKKIPRWWTLKMYHRSESVGRQRGENKIIGRNHCLIQTDGEWSPEITNFATGHGSGAFITAYAWASGVEQNPHNCWSKWIGLVHLEELHQMIRTVCFKKSIVYCCTKYVFWNNIKVEFAAKMKCQSLSGTDLPAREVTLDYTSLRICLSFYCSDRGSVWKGRPVQLAAV